MMWPAHCIQNSAGAEFHQNLLRHPTDIVVRKGQSVHIDSYSGFFDNDHKNKTEMLDVLRNAGISLLRCFFS